MDILDVIDDGKKNDKVPTFTYSSSEVLSPTEEVFVKKQKQTPCSKKKLQKGQQKLNFFTRKRDKKCSQEESIEDEANPKDVLKYTNLAKKKAAPTKRLKT
jgi:hypothetical protein